MTMTAEPATHLRRRTRPERTPESKYVAALRVMLENPAEQPNWPEIRQAIEYLTATSALGA